MGFSIQQLYRNHIALLCVVLVPLLTGILAFFAMLDQKAIMGRELRLQTAMVASQLLDKDAASAEELKAILMQLRTNPSVKIACLLDARGTTRAYIVGTAMVQGEAENCNVATRAAIAKDALEVRAPLMKTALPQASGEVLLFAKTPSMFDRLVRWFMVATGVAGLIALLSWFVGSEFERVVLMPIRHIAMTAQRVSLYKDYSLRVEAPSLAMVPSEIEALIDSFNAMLHEIEDRDNRLTRKGDELEKSRKAAVVASQAKSQFLANVSHELRTPLNAIIGFSTMLENQQFGALGHEKYAEYAKDIHESGKHLLDVINDILDLSKAESGVLRMKFEQLSLHKMVEKTLNIISGQAMERKIDIYTDMPEKLPKLYADRVRIVQILLNLLSNAIKFSNEGGKVVLRARAEPAKNQIHYFTIEVEDSGIGMSTDEIAKAFQTFNQSDAGLNRKYDGAGLGLPLTKRLVELHHGKIKIESTKGLGTLVTVRLTSDPALLD